jgi:uncharacterized Zn finger protein
MAGNLTLDQIRGRATEQSYQRGEAYYKSDAVIDTVRRGSELEGYCEGSQSFPYHIQVALSDQGIESASCTCEYDWGGDCKHIVALLLTYLHNPQAFEERQPVRDVLAQRSKEELITLIREMIARYPDLSVLIDRPLPGAYRRNTPVYTDSFRRELRYAMNHYEGWGDHTAEHAVESITKTAAQFAGQGDWRSARAIYSAVLEEGLEEDNYPFDDEGDFMGALYGAVEGLIECLDQDEIAKDDTERRAVFNTLLDVYIWNCSMGGYGLSDGVDEAILAHATRSDLPEIRERITAAQNKRRARPYSKWSVESYEQFLIDLDTLDEVDPELVLKRLREHGLYDLLFKKLLQMQRGEEAIAVAAQHLIGPYERLQAVSQLTQAGHSYAAINLAREALDKAYDERLTAWLLEQYQARGDQEACLQLQRQQMLAAPSEPHYAALKESAQGLGRWETLRPEIIAWLKRKRYYPVLIRASLHDQDWDAAWETFEKHGTPPRGSREVWAYLHLDFEIAQRSHVARPQQAIPVYIKYARAEINHRNRDSYRTAAQHLGVVRKLYRQTSNESAWNDLIGSIRAEFKQLPALKDELNKAGL